ncbi:MAG TPA: hypothetical protein VG433_01765, partial [Pirellulales bacterium]|nr:hypothetical protein [Pirellulales bacterium]
MAADRRRLLPCSGRDVKSAVKLAAPGAETAPYLHRPALATVPELTIVRAVTFGQPGRPPSRGSSLGSCAELAASTCRYGNASDDDYPRCFV